MKLFADLVKKLYSLSSSLILKTLGIVGGEGFNTRLLPLSLLLRCFVVQKIFCINRNVPWPVDWTSTIRAPENINRGSRFPGLSKGCHIDGRNGIIFGSNVWIGPGVKIISMNHYYDNYTKYKISDPIVIGDNCWIAADAKILQSVCLGHHTIVGAGSVVTKSFLDCNQLIAGIPAKRIKNLPAYHNA